MFNKLLSWFTILLGLVAMCIILLIPENYEVYKPVFYVKVLWLVAMGAVLLKNGVHLSED